MGPEGVARERVCDNGHGRTGETWIAILAAGASRRMGRQKLLLPLPNGRTMLRTVVDAALAASGCGVIVVIDGADDTSGRMKRRELASLPVVIAANDDAQLGQSTSIHRAVLEVQRRQGEAVLFLLGDEPDLRSEAVEAMLVTWRATKAPLAQTRYRDGYGHPVLFSSELFDELLACSGDEGGRSVVARHLTERMEVVIDGERPNDVDTPEAYQALLARWQKEPGK